MTANDGLFPPNWTWRESVVSAGPAVVIDVDGVIADGSHRQHHLRGGRNDWRGFFAAAVDDTPIAGAVDMLDVFDEQLCLVLLTARPHNLHGVTLSWLQAHRFRWDLLIMRERSDGGLSSPEFKRRSVHELRERDFDLRLALDDDRRNIEMFKDENISALYVHSGYYEA